MVKVNFFSYSILYICDLGEASHNLWVMLIQDRKVQIWDYLKVLYRKVTGYIQHRVFQNKVIYLLNITYCSFKTCILGYKIKEVAWKVYHKPRLLINLICDVRWRISVIQLRLFMDISPNKISVPWTIINYISSRVWERTSRYMLGDGVLDNVRISYTGCMSGEVFCLRI